LYLCNAVQASKRRRHGSPKAHSRARRNRSILDLESDEILAQILDRGELSAWRDLYAAAQGDPALRARIRHVVENVPLATAPSWQAALVALGEPVEWTRLVREDDSWV